MFSWLTWFLVALLQASAAVTLGASVNVIPPSFLSTSCDPAAASSSGSSASSDPHTIDLGATCGYSAIAGAALTFGATDFIYGATPRSSVGKPYLLQIFRVEIQ